MTTLPELLQTLSLGVVRLNCDNVIVDCNPAALKLLELERDALLGIPFDHLVVDPSADINKVSANDPHLAMEVRLKGSRKEPFWARLILSLEPNTGNTIVLLEDVSARKRAEQRTAVQHAVAAILSEPTNLAAATPRILEATCLCLDWDLGGLWRVDRAAGLLRFVDIWHTSSLDAREFLDETIELAIARDVGIPGQAWSSATAVWVNDVPSAVNFPRGPVAARVGLHAAFAFPIIVGHEVVGVMDFFSREIRPPDAEILQTFSTIGSQIGQFIERNRAEEDVRALAAQLSAAEDLERRRLARDIHDSIGQTLSVVKMKTAALAERSHELRPILTLLDGVIAQTRSMTFDLYPTMLDDLGLVPTLERFAEGLAPLSITVTQTGRPQALPYAATTYLFRATKELLNNIAKHAKANSAIAAIHWSSNGIRIVVADDGVGFDAVRALAPQNRRGLGLADLRERIRFLGGTFDVESGPTEGTRVILGLPLDREELRRTPSSGRWP